MTVTANDHPAASAERDPQSLSLAELRAYRQRLTVEEDKVAYWQRLAHARIDGLEGDTDHEDNLSHRDLLRALGDTGTGQARRVLGTVRATDALPSLPDLARTWLMDVDLRDPEQVAEALEQVRTAAGQLSLYCRAIHSRIGEANAELIRRYRENPLLALSLLPH